MNANNIIVTVKVEISLWDAFKLRLAGKNVEYMKEGGNKEK